MAEPPPVGFPPRPTTDEAEAMRRRRRGRNVALLVVLIALVALFYAISMVKLSGG